MVQEIRDQPLHKVLSKNKMVREMQKQEWILKAKKHKLKNIKSIIIGNGMYRIKFEDYVVEWDVYKWWEYVFGVVLSHLNVLLQTFAVHITFFSHIILILNQRPLAQAFISDIWIYISDMSFEVAILKTLVCLNWGLPPSPVVKQTP